MSSSKTPAVADSSSAAATGADDVRLSRLDRFLPVWIGVAMAAGLGLGALVPGFDTALASIEVAGVSLPIALGLLLMMYPVLAKVRYAETGQVTGDRRLLVASLVLNWVLGPALMFALAWLLLPNLPEYRTGLIIVGLARCIAMVLVWNELARGDREAAAVLVAINSVFQVLAFAALGWFYLQVLPGWLGLPTTSAEFSITAIALSVLVFLGIPLAAGFLTRTLGERARGRDWYENTFLPKISPITLGGLLFTIVMLFALQGEAITRAPLDVVRIASPLRGLLFLGIPLAAGFLTRTLGERTRGRDWYENTFLPKISPITLGGLLFTIVMLFALQGEAITRAPLDVVRIAIPLLGYFAGMFALSWFVGSRLRLGYPRTTTLAFTAAGNNFELAIAVAIGTFGATSGQALAGVVGPLIEVPVLVALVHVALRLRPTPDTPLVPAGRRAAP